MYLFYYHWIPVDNYNSAEYLFKVFFMASVSAIVCLIPRTNVTLLRAPERIHAARRIFFVSVFLFERVRKHSSCMRDNKCLPPEYALTSDTVVLEVRQSIVLFGTSSRFGWSDQAKTFGSR